MSFKRIIAASACLMIASGWGCSKLNENLGSTFTNSQTATALGSQGVGLILQGAYVDFRYSFYSTG